MKLTVNRQKTESSRPDVANLLSAFAQFEQVSAQLQQAYRDMDHSASMLSEELRQARQGESGSSVNNLQHQPEKEQNSVQLTKQITAGLAHQLRTPLASAILNVSRLTGGDECNDQQLQTVAKIRISLHYLETIINDMLNCINRDDAESINYSLQQAERFLPSGSRFTSVVENQWSGELDDKC